VVVLDIDNQPLYTKEFRNSAGATGKAGDEITRVLMSDDKFVQAFKAH